MYNSPIFWYNYEFQGTKDEWLQVFNISGIIFIIGCVVYILFGSSELQQWAKPNQRYVKAKI